MTPGKRPVIKIAGIDRRLIGWQSTRRQQIADVMPALVADYEEVQGHEPGEQAAYAPDQQAAERLRPDRTDRKAGRDQEQATDVATVEQTRRFALAAAAKLRAGMRERAVAHGPRPQPAPETPTSPRTQPPALPPAPGRSTPTGGVA